MPRAKIVYPRPDDKAVVRAYHESREAQTTLKWPNELLMERFKCSALVARNAIVRATAKGYISYGTTLLSGRVTDKGFLLLRIKPNYCDCERSHNGIGMAGRMCDCQQEQINAQ
jgi:hypothetical protein